MRNVVLEARLEQANLLKKVYPFSQSLRTLLTANNSLGRRCHQRPCARLQL